MLGNILDENVRLRFKNETTYSQGVKNFQDNNAELIENFQKLNPKINFVFPETVLPYRDKKYASLIEKARNTDVYIERAKKEANALQQLKDGTYGYPLDKDPLK